MSALRLKPGVTHEVANAALQPLIEQFAKETPKHFPDDHFQFYVVGLNEDFVRDLGGTLYLLFSAVALLLAIGCGNVSILLLARGTARQHEFAVRTAIGASRRRLIRQLLTESLLLSLTGAALGVLLAYRALAVIIESAAEIFLPARGRHPDQHARCLALQRRHRDAHRNALRSLAGAATLASRSQPGDAVQHAQDCRRRARTHDSQRPHRRQIALTLLMLAGAGAAMQGFLRLLHTPLGYDPHNVMSVGIPVHDGAYPTWAARSAYFEQLQPGGHRSRCHHDRDLHQRHAALQRLEDRRRDPRQAAAR